MSERHGVGNGCASEGEGRREVANLPGGLESGERASIAPERSSHYELSQHLHSITPHPDKAVPVVLSFRSVLSLRTFSVYLTYRLERHANKPRCYF